MAFNFEELRVWQKGLELSGRVHLLTKNFPSDELYILSAQIKRAADSVVLNIAEGSQGQTKAEFNRFLSFSLRSAIEVISCLYLAKERKILDDNQFRIFYQEYSELIKSIQALRNAIKVKSV
jgi:four helix bundle protein